MLISIFHHTDHWKHFGYLLREITQCSFNMKKYATAKEHSEKLPVLLAFTMYTELSQTVGFLFMYIMRIFSFLSYPMSWFCEGRAGREKQCGLYFLSSSFGWDPWIQLHYLDCMDLWALWPSCWCPCLLQGNWTRWPSMVLSNSDHSMIPLSNNIWFSVFWRWHLSWRLCCPKLSLVSFSTSLSGR